MAIIDNCPVPRVSPRVRNQVSPLNSALTRVKAMAVVVKTNGIPFWLVGEFTTHVSLFKWGLGCSLGVRAFDPQPYIASSYCGQAGAGPEVRSQGGLSLPLCFWVCFVFNPGRLKQLAETPGPLATAGGPLRRFL